MPIFKTEILGTDIEISYEKNEYDKLNNLIEKFKIRLSQFPNDGRASSNQILFLSALKTEDELETIKKKIDVNANEKNLQNKNLVIEGLNKEIILLKKELEKLKSSNISNTQDNNSVLDEIIELKKITKLIQDRIKESGIHYPKPIPEHPMYETLIHRSNGCKNSKQICDTILTLPMNPYLEEEEIEEVINIILLSV